MNADWKLRRGGVHWLPAYERSSDIWCNGEATSRARGICVAPLNYPATIGGAAMSVHGLTLSAIEALAS